MNTLIKFKDLICNYPNRYQIDGVRHIIEKDWNVVEPGTLNKADYYNEIQTNLEFSLDSTYTSTEYSERYNVMLDGIEEFGEYCVKLKIRLPEGNKTDNIYIDINNLFRYPLLKYNESGNLEAISIGLFKANQFINVELKEIDGVKVFILTTIGSLVTEIESITEEEIIEMIDDAYYDVYGLMNRGDKS